MRKWARNYRDLVVREYRARCETKRDETWDGGRADPAAALAAACAIVGAAYPTNEAEWLALHDAVQANADGAPHPWLVLAHVGEALVALRPDEPNGEVASAP